MSLYPDRTDRRARLLCVFAHPDDEVFCVGGTLARWVALGGEAMVLSATRGEAYLVGGAFSDSEGDEREFDQLVSVDISAHIEHKFAALAAHRTQFSIDPTMFPLKLVRDLLGSEYFERVGVSTPISGWNAAVA